jgi:hypothetical protein
MKTALFLFLGVAVLCLQTTLASAIPFVGQYLDLILVCLVLVIFLVEDKWPVLYCLAGGIIADLFYPNWFFHVPLFLLLYLGAAYLKKNMREENPADLLPALLIVLPAYFLVKTAWFYVFTKEVPGWPLLLLNMFWYSLFNLVLAFMAYPLLKALTGIIHEQNIYMSQSRTIR